MIIYKPYDDILIEGLVGALGVDASSQSKTKIGDSISQTNSCTTNTNQTNTNTTNQIDNSIQSNNQTQSNTTINANQDVTSTNEIDQSSVMNITSSTDTFNYDNSQTTNQTTSNIENKMIQSCGATIEQAQATINIVKNESINTNINNGNVFINTGDNVTISDVRLESELDFLGGNVDKSCMLDAANELTNELESENVNSKSFAGGTGGEISAFAGGNTAANDNIASKEDTVSADLETENELTQEATTEVTTETTTETSSEMSTTQSQSQALTTTSSSQSGSGGIFIVVGILISIIVGFVFLKKFLKNRNQI
jgi:hypothetical protein